MYMKKTTLVIALMSIGFIGSAQANSFVNGGFEDGNINGWTNGGGSWSSPYTAPVNPVTYNGGSGPYAIMNSGSVDPITGAATVYNGSHSVRLNDSINNYSVSTLRQSVTNYTDNNIYFQWNAVLESSHGLTDSDYFSLTLVDTTKGITIVNRGYGSAGAIGGGTSGVTWTAYGNWFSGGWVLESVDLTTAGVGGASLVGDDFTLTVLASDCPYGGHAGYVYLDGFAPVIVTPGPNGVPEPGTLALAGLGLLTAAGLRRRKNV
jgi:hypothetical protein